MQKFAKLDKQTATMIKRQNNLARGKGIKIGKKLGIRKGILINIFTILTLGIVGTGAYISILAYEAQKINLVNEINTTDLGTIVIKNADNGASDAQILLAMITANGDTTKYINNYQVTNVNYNSTDLSGIAEIRSTNWLSKQEIKVTYKVQVQ